MEWLSKNRHIIKFDEIESTNSYLKKLVREKHIEEGTIIIADFQTGGRGQMGNSWFSSKYKNLLFSLVIYPYKVKANEQFIISRIVSLAIKKLLEQFTGNISIKWPNDIYWNNKKIAGILIENDLLGDSIDNSVIGIGLNINEKEFPDELPNPVSLFQITGKEYDREVLLDIFITEFSKLYSEMQKSGFGNIENEYMTNLYRKDNYYWFEDANGRFKAKIEDVLPSGHLILSDINSNIGIKYSFKEVKFTD